MLIKSSVLDKIVAGDITLLFRRWKRASVKSGGTQMTQQGVLGIESVAIVSESKITNIDAKAAGFDSKKELLGSMPDSDLDIYRIKVSFIGEDPRKALRTNDKLTKTELDEIISKLNKMDARSKNGPWTRVYLQMISERPNTHAAILAKQVGLDTLRFKPMVRRLKALGLTESLSPGYRLSPRGRKVLAALAQKRSR